MTRLILCVLCLTLILPTLVAAETAQESQLEAVASAVRMTYPSIPVKQIGPTPVDGIFEIITKKEEILYFAPRTGHMFVGELWSKAGQNLTRDSKGRLMTAKLEMFPLDKALKIGDGPNQVVEVSDPDCPFCRDGSEFFSARDDVTRYIFLYPLDRIHPQAEAKARYILSAEDQETAYEEVFTGAYDKQPVPMVKDNGLLATHREIVRKVGINSTPRYWINGKFVSGSNLKQFEKLLTK